MIILPEGYVENGVIISAQDGPAVGETRERKVTCFCVQRKQRVFAIKESEL